MNRQQRRAASKAQDTKPVAERSAADKTIASPEPKPGLTLRTAAFLLLSPWVLRRVRSPHVLGMLQEVARQAGREKVVRQLDERIKDLQ